MHKDSEDAEDEVPDMVDQLSVQEDLPERLVEGAHVAHDADQVDSLEDDDGHSESGEGKLGPDRNNQAEDGEEREQLKGGRAGDGDDDRGRNQQARPQQAGQVTARVYNPRKYFNHILGKT